MDALLEPLIHSPKLPQYVAELTETLRVEAERRQRFYEEITEANKWEFIDGEAIMHSPAKNRHLWAVKLLTKLMDTYVSMRGLGVVHSEKCMVRFPRNDYEPDIVFFGAEKAATFSATTMLFPPPDLVVEVLSDSTTRFDRGVKFQDYEVHVPEYWIIDPTEEVVEQYLIRSGSYELKLKTGNGMIRSEVIEGFQIPIRAIFDEGENLEALWSLRNR